VIRRSPAEKYLKYLILQGLEADEVVTRAQKEHLDPLGEWYIQELEEGLNPPHPFYPKDQYHWPSQQFLLKEGLLKLFFPDEHTKIAWKILRTPRAKEFVEAMTLSGAPSEMIRESLTFRKNFKCTPEAIDQYKKYFWNLEFVDSTETKALLSMRVDAPAGSNDSDIQKQHKHLKAASYNDPRKVAASLPCSPLTALMSQMRMGVMPKRVDVARVFEAVRFSAGLRAVEATMSGEQYASERTRDFMLASKLAGELLETVVRPEDQLINELSSIALKTDEAPIPTLRQLSGGEHTVSVLPMEEEEVHAQRERSEGTDEFEEGT